MTEVLGNIGSEDKPGAQGDADPRDTGEVINGLYETSQRYVAIAKRGLNRVAKLNPNVNVEVTEATIRAAHFDRIQEISRRLP